MYENRKTRSGNRIVVLMDGKAVGLIQSVRMSDDYAPDAASGVGDIHVQEYVPTQARHMISVSQMVLNVTNMRKAGVSVENGDGALRGLVFDFHLMDKDTGETLRKYEGVSYASGDVEVSKHAIVMSSGQFNALNVTGLGI